MVGIANKIVDRVIMCLTNNEKYIDFWNYTSKVYATKFSTLPTLMFSGTKEELDGLMSSGRLSTKYGDIVHLPRVDGVHYDASLDWTCTWGLFYGASLFPNDVCMLSGIDQIPLSGRFYDVLQNIGTRDRYIIGFSDAYGDPNAYYPSSHHVGLGNFFKSIYKIEDDWDTELRKVYTNKEIRSLFTSHSLWGIDEAYSTYILRNYMKTNTQIPIVLVTEFASYWMSRRIDRAYGVIPVTEQLLSAIRASQFTEYHSVRPFSANENMEEVYEAIPLVPNVSSF